MENNENNVIDVNDAYRDRSFLSKIFEINLVIKVAGVTIVDWHFPPQKS